MAGYFTGKYIKDMAELCVTGLVTGMHAMLIGEPGWGKTDVPRSILKDIMPGAHAFVRITENTQAEVIEGATDIEHLLKVSQFRINPTGTPYDPTIKAILLDELPRGNETILDMFLPLLDRKNGANVPVIATGNFLPTEKRFEALLDRIALWAWPKIEACDVAAIVEAQMRGGMDDDMHVDMTLPTLSDLAGIYAARPGENAIKAVRELAAQVAAEALKEGIAVHPRRAWQWQNVLYRVGVWKAGSADFAAVHPDAVSALRFAYQMRSREDQTKWGQIVSAFGDPLAASIELILESAAKAVNEVAGKDMAERMAANTHLISAEASLKSLVAQYPADLRLPQAIVTIKEWFVALAKGEKVVRV